MANKIFIVLIIAIAIAMLIVPISAAKPGPTPTPSNAVWDAIYALQAQVAGLQTQVAALITKITDLETNTVTKAEYNALDEKVTALQTRVDSLEKRIAALEAGNTCTPSNEVCDGKDNDCDEQTDEGFLCGDGWCVDGGCRQDQLPCPLVLSCMSNCQDYSCQLDCYMRGSSSAKSLVTALNQCATEMCKENPDPNCVTDYCPNEYQTCLADGGEAECGDGTCNTDETTSNCPADCPPCTDTDNDEDGYTNCENDCNDSDKDINPGASEVCNLKDDNCDGEFDGPLADAACGQGMICTSEGICVTDSSECGDGTCNDDEDAATCPDDCKETGCGDGVLGSGETCDDNNTVDGDGCSATCTIESGYICTPLGCELESYCNDGWSDPVEQCEDDNNSPGDGCYLCAAEPGWTCNPSTGECSPICGDGICVGSETSSNCLADCPQCFDNDDDGYTTCEGDCEDKDPEMYPGALEICDTIDNDCYPATVDGSADPMVGVSCDGEDSDLCMEGQTICLDGSVICDDRTDNISEVCNTLDDDCDGSVDNGSLCEFTNAVGSCDSGECKIDYCIGDWLDCDDIIPGCETDGSSDMKNCNSCGNTCTGYCLNGACVNS